MAKMKTWAVEVEVTVKRTLFVEARREAGAVEKLKTEAGWREASRYADDMHWPMRFDDQVEITRVRVAEL